MNLFNKNIVLGITGSIAAYKSAELAKLLITAGAKVQVIMTASAQHFVTPLVLQTITQHEVHTECFTRQAAMEHINLARWADMILIAPATAAIMAKIATGIADDLLTSMVLAATVPLVVAPAMNRAMWHNPATQANLRLLKERGVKVLGPEVGLQACGEYGEGRMLAVPEIVAALPTCLPQGVLAGTKVVVTAGPTREPLDPVRFISNRSSGKMGYAIANAAKQAGAQVTLISGPVANLVLDPDIELLKVTSAASMYDAVMAEVTACQIFIGVAAVADYYCATPLAQKVAKSSAGFTISLLPTPDIIAAVAQVQPRPLVIGFAAETQDLLAKAYAKLVHKNLDIIVANYVGADCGYDQGDNEVAVLWRDKRAQELQTLTYPLTPKQQLAQDLISLFANLYTGASVYHQQVPKGS